jgi:hypothetical protein
MLENFGNLRARSHTCKTNIVGSAEHNLDDQGEEDTFGTEADSRSIK